MSEDKVKIEETIKKASEVIQKLVAVGSKIREKPAD